MNQVFGKGNDINAIVSEFQWWLSDEVFGSVYMTDYISEKEWNLRWYFTLSNDFRSDKLDTYLESELYKMWLSFEGIAYVLCSKTIRKDIVERIEWESGESRSFESCKKVIDERLSKLIMSLSESLEEVRVSQSSLRIGSLSNQFYEPADGLGHLLRFPKSELLNHADRLTKILENNGFKTETIYREWDWKKDIITNVPTEYIQLLIELWDINRAISIWNTIWWNLFRIIRNSTLSNGIVLQDGTKLNSFIVDAKDIEEKWDYSPYMMQDDIMARFKIIVEYIRSQQLSFIDIEKIQKSLEFWTTLDPSQTLREDFDTSYLEIFHEFVEGIVTIMDMSWELDNHKKYFSEMIDSLNWNGEGFSLDIFLEGLETEDLRWIFEKNFLDRQVHKDKYPNTSRADMMTITRDVLFKKFSDVFISKALVTIQGVKGNSVKVLLSTSSMPNPIDPNYSKELV